MEDILKKSLDFSNYQSTLSVQRKIIKEKLDAGLTLGYSGGIFKINPELITFVQFFIDQGRVDGVPMIDSNGNPVLIEDMNDFKETILDRYFSSVFEYHESFQKIKKSRSVEKLLDL
jgi:hypothetical protein